MLPILVGFKERVFVLLVLVLSDFCLFFTFLNKGELLFISCRLGPSATLVGLLEDVINSLQTCGIVGQIDLRDLVVGENIYKKEYYLEVLKEAYIHGGMCGKLTLIPYLY